MSTVIHGLREILGIPVFYDSVNQVWQYDLMIEYLAGALILIVVISSVFRLIGKVISR